MPAPRDQDLVSADSHVVEPPSIFTDYIEPEWRQQAPRLIPDSQGGEQLIIPGMPRVLGLGLLASAGCDPAALRETGTTFSRIRTGSWDPSQRLRDQEIDGIAAEVIYPSIGLVIFTHINRQYATACFRAYNRWLADFCSVSPHRLIGCGATAAATPDKTDMDLKEIHRLGCRGAIFPLEPGTEAYDSAAFDPVWKTATELGLPIVFHAQPPRLNSYDQRSPVRVMASIWEAQDLLLTLVFGGVFMRHPQLRVVFAEFDADWVPHCVQRMDHYFARHRRWLGLGKDLDRLPSDYVRESVLFTVQDGHASTQPVDPTFIKIMWGSDFPHAESTFPQSHAAATRLTATYSHQYREAVISGTVRSLFGLDQKPPTDQRRGPLARPLARPVAD